jgi:excisionase family DNA binding protein
VDGSGGSSTDRIDVTRDNGNGSGARLWTTQDVARFLSVHEKTVYDWVRGSGLPCFRLGNRLRFDAQDVLRWVSARKEG